MADRFGPTPRRRSLLGECGYALVEVAVVSLILAVGLVAILDAIVQSGRLTHGSQRQEQAIAYGQREIEKIRSLPWSQAALESIPAHEGHGNTVSGDTNPTNPSYYVTSGSPGCFAVKANYRDYTSGLGEPCEDLVGGGQVAPGPSPIDVNGTTAKVYRYVTAVNAGCMNAVVTICLDSSGAHIRRVTVAVVLDLPSGTGRGPHKPIYVSSIVSDPETPPLGIGP
jgi:Tfp pilus assembly protein PilV